MAVGRETRTAAAGKLLPGFPLGLGRLDLLENLAGAQPHCRVRVRHRPRQMRDSRQTETDEFRRGVLAFGISAGAELREAVTE